MQCPQTLYFQHSHCFSCVCVRVCVCVCVLQSLAAQWISRLLDLCKDRSPTPNAKIIKNLCSFACADSHHTPPVRTTSGHDTTPAAKKKARPKKAISPTSANEEAGSNTEKGGDLWAWDSGIITLIRQQKEVCVVHVCVRVLCGFTMYT